MKIEDRPGEYDEFLGRASTAYGPASDAVEVRLSREEEVLANARFVRKTHAAQVAAVLRDLGLSTLDYCCTPYATLEEADASDGRGEDASYDVLRAAHLSPGAMVPDEAYEEGTMEELDAATLAELEAWL
jgi:hypothetical protein